MPILSMLEAAPRDATWGDWLKFLRDLVDLAIRDIASRFSPRWPSSSRWRRSVRSDSTKCVWC